MGARFRMPGSPVFRRKSDAPEGRARSGEFEADFSLAAAHGTEEHHAALLFLFGAPVLKVNGAAAGDARFEQNERAVGVDGKSVREFLERLALRIGAANANSHLHENALTAPPGAGMGRLRHGDDATSVTPSYTGRLELSRDLPGVFAKEKTGHRAIKTIQERCSMGT